jgi:hypothetical protein
MRKNAGTLNTTDYADFTDGSWLASDTDALQLECRFGAPASRAVPLLIHVIRAIRGETYFGVN